MLGKVLALSTLAAFVLLSALMHSTSPSTIHPIGILAAFILIYMLSLGVLSFFVYSAVNIMGRLWRRPVKISLKNAYFYASVLALAPVMLIGMRSIGRANVYEVFLVIIFEVVACFYISRQR